MLIIFKYTNQSMKLVYSLRTTNVVPAPQCIFCTTHVVLMQHMWYFYHCCLLETQGAGEGVQGLVFLLVPAQIQKRGNLDSFSVLKTPPVSQENPRNTQYAYITVSLCILKKNCCFQETNQKNNQGQIRNHLTKWDFCAII